jgi:hypothetical protein
MKKYLIALIMMQVFHLYAQTNYWQQGVNYEMKIVFDTQKNQFSGNQRLTYTNNSPDTLYKVYYHLYYNAFQPNSMMDVRSRTIEDPDKRVQDRISKLMPDEIGFQEIEELSQNGVALSFKIEYTVLEALLSEPLLPGATTLLEMSFHAQVPLQIRRTGRDNAEGIEYSMSQWYPKLAEYDIHGWHTHPYVAREFYAPWGNFDVSITIDKNYVLAGSGILQNANEIGYGYQEDGVEMKKNKNKTLTWHFIAENVHDFMWAADPDYTHQVAQVPNGPKLHFFYQLNSETLNWQSLPALTISAFTYMNEHFGKYPYSDFYVVQGGDGGMEYPMSTLITGNRSLESLIGVTVHEAMHSWYQGVLATNESYYPWMDEGYTSYATSLTMNHIWSTELRPMSASYQDYYNLVKSGKEEPMSTHADHFETNMAYSIASYDKGSISLSQLGYIVGETTLEKILLTYFYRWQFKHPNLADFVKVAEDVSKLELDWYYNYWVNSIKTIDYSIDSISRDQDQTHIQLNRIGKMPMPIDLVVTLKNGSKINYYIPLSIMRGEKSAENGQKRETLIDWYWTSPTYSVNINIDPESIESIEIDPSQRMADVDRSNNTFINH